MRKKEKLNFNIYLTKIKKKIINKYTKIENWESKTKE